MADIDTVYSVIPRTRKVNLTCGDFEIRPLTNIAFITLLADMKDMQGKLTRKLGVDPEHEVIVEALSLAGPRLPEILGKLMGIKGCSAEVKEQLAEMTLEDTSVVARAIAEVNNFSGMLKNFQAAMEKKEEPRK